MHVERGQPKDDDAQEICNAVAAAHASQCTLTLTLCALPLPIVLPLSYRMPQVERKVITPLRFGVVFGGGAFGCHPYE